MYVDHYTKVRSVFFHSSICSRLTWLLLNVSFTVHIFLLSRAHVLCHMETLQYVAFMHLSW